MTHTLVVGAAPVPGQEAFYKALLAAASRVVAADGGAEWCVSMGRVPDVAVGDFDSSAEGAVDRLRGLGADVVAVPCDKDETDLDLAVSLALAMGGPVMITAAFTLRLDHTLAAVGALMRAGRGARVCEPAWSGWAVVPCERLVLDLPAGTTVSVLAPEGAEGVSVTGVVWPLNDATLQPLSGLGVSNRVDTGPVRVATGRGTLVVIALDNVTDGLY